MHLKLPFIILALSILVVNGYDDTLTHPVGANEVRHILISNYTGPLKYDTLEVFSNLEDLHLTNSHFEPFNASFLLAIPNLKRLRISSSILQAVDFDPNGCCEELEELEITTGDKIILNEAVLKMIKAMKNLKRLLLRNFELRTLLNNNFLGPNLTHLTLKGCSLRTIQDNAFAKLKKLEDLNLEFNFIVDIKKEIFAPLSNVKRINLKGNLLEWLKTEQIPPLPNLEKLIVSYNRITECNLEGIKNLAPKLTRVDISGNEVHLAESGGVKLINYADGRY